MRIELTRLTKQGGPLTKRISLSPDGTLVKDSSSCVMAHGTAERVKVAGVDALAALIEELTPSQALALGALRPDLPDKVEITTKKKLLNGVARPDIIARTGANITYNGPAFALLDYDSKGMPTAVAAEFARVGGVWAALRTVLPTLGAAAHMARINSKNIMLNGKPLGECTKADLQEFARQERQRYNELVALTAENMAIYAGSLDDKEFVKKAKAAIQQFVDLNNADACCSAG
jgi:hypothetical protein